MTTVGTWDCITENRRETSLQALSSTFANVPVELEKQLMNLPVALIRLVCLVFLEKNKPILEMCIFKTERTTLDVCLEMAAYLYLYSHCIFSNCISPAPVGSSAFRKIVKCLLDFPASMQLLSKTNL